MTHRLSLALCMIVVGLSACERAPSAGTNAGVNPSSAKTEIHQQAEAAGRDKLPVVRLEQINEIREQAQAAGQYLVIDFWATWCTPCVEIFPQLHDLVKKQGERVRLVSITFDDPGEYETKAIAFLHQHDALHDAYMIDADTDQRLRVVEALGQKWDQLVVPAILVYSPEGELVGEFIDGKWESIRNLLESLGQ